MSWSDGRKIAERPQAGFAARGMQEPMVRCPASKMYAGIRGILDSVQTGQGTCARLKYGAVNHHDLYSHLCSKQDCQ